MNIFGLSTAVALAAIFLLPLPANGDRSEFPGRRQGGGTHVVPPSVH